MKITGQLAERGFHAFDAEPKSHQGHKIPRIWIVVVDGKKSHIYRKLESGLDLIADAEFSDKRIESFDGHFFKTSEGREKRDPDKRNRGRNHDGSEFSHSLAQWLDMADNEHVFDELVLQAAVQAPNAMHEEPWAFLVVQNAETLKLISTKSAMTKQEDKRNLHFQPTSGGVSQPVKPEIDTLHGAGTLIVVYARPLGPFVAADCWLAAQNIMLSACELGLGSCVIGMAVNALNEPDMKKTLGVPSEMTAIAPIIIGYSKGDVPPTSRKEPVVLGWQ